MRKALKDRVDRAILAEIHGRIPLTLINAAIAIEHIVLEAVELGLDSCWCDSSREENKTATGFTRKSLCGGSSPNRRS